MKASPKPTADGKNGRTLAGSARSTSTITMPSVAPAASSVRAVGSRCDRPPLSTRATASHEIAAGAGTAGVPMTV